MQVFKTFLKIAVRKIPSVILYFVIFAIIAILLSSDAEQKNGFESTKLSISVHDLDNTTASHELISFIEQNHTLVDVGESDEQITDALFYHTINYSLTINEGFEQKLESGETDGLFESVKDEDYQAVFFEGQLEQYISAVSMYIAQGMDAKQACNEASLLSSISTDVTVESFSQDEGGYLMYFTQYLAYIFISIMIVGLSPILATFNKPDIRRRIDSSSLLMSKKTLQLILGSLVVTAIVWLAFMLLGIALYGSEMFTKTGVLTLLNTLVYIVISMGAAMLVAQFDINENTIPMVSNVFGMGMSFLCGVFVPQNLLSSLVLGIAKFLPAYWFVKANNMLYGVGDTAFTMTKYLTYLGIELLFAIALFSAVMAVSRSKMQTSE
ncbi:MAG: ABC transporter permease [Ruminococcus sp.]|nr:ABC transporter permease [Ruminococcus sp.]